MTPTEPLRLRFGRDGDGAYLEVDDHRYSLSAEQARHLRKALQGTAPTLDIVLEAQAPSSAVHAKPAPMPATAPVTVPDDSAPVLAHTTSTGHDREPAAVDGQALQFLPAARGWADRLGVTADRIAEILERPDDEWVDDSRTGQASIVVGGDLAIATTIAGDLVLSVGPRSRVRKPRSRGAGARGHGGVGRRYVTTLRDLHRQLRDLGFDVDDQPGRHTKITRSGVTYTLPSTPSDHRSLMNSIKGIEKHYGLSLARHP